MTVYWEYAFAENFMLDLLLLYLCLKCVKARVRILRLLLAASVGAAEAIVFPLLPLSAWAAYLVKFLGGVLLVLVALSKGTKKRYLLAVALFFGETFALGGLLVAIYSFFGISYDAESGYLVESAPVGLVLGGAGLFAVAVLRAAKGLYRYKKVQSALFPIEFGGERTLTLKGFADSGNLLAFRGHPVCVISPPAALLLFRSGYAPLGRMCIETVGGAREAPVFCRKDVKIGENHFGEVYFTVGDVCSKEYQIILHTSYTEGCHETCGTAARLATEDKE